MTDMDEKETRAEARRKLRELAPTALAALRDIAKNGETEDSRREAREALESHGFTVDGNEPIVPIDGSDPDN